MTKLSNKTAKTLNNKKRKSGCFATNNHKQFQVLLFLAAAVHTYLLSFDLRGLLGNRLSHFNFHLSDGNRLSIGLSLLGGGTERHNEQ